MRKLWQKVTSSIRRRGFLDTLKLSVRRAPELPRYWSNYRYDAVHGTQTGGIVPLHEILDPEDPRANGYRYEPTGVATFRKLLASVSPPRDVGFVDYGCGRGRVLLMAAEYGFNRVTGVEFVPTLADAARANLRTYRVRNARVPRLEVLDLDAREFLPHDDDAVFYFYNPFEAEVLEAALEQITLSRRRRPRPVWVLYHNPKWRSVIDRNETFRLTSEHRFERYEVCVYEARDQ